MKKTFLILFAILATLTAPAQEIKKSSLTAGDLAQARCCDDVSLSPDLTNDVFRNSPHYYVIGLKLSPR